jgi:predicted lipoprotein with Yx(FWY)xxD motif
MTLFRGAAAAVVACLIFTASCATQKQREAGATPGQVVETEEGLVLATGAGLTLYIYEEDEPGVSNCIADCAEIWSPFTASGDAEAAGEWSVITRADGGKQWAYNGYPLYTWIEDQQPGDIRGADIPEWQIARP